MKKAFVVFLLAWTLAISPALSQDEVMDETPNVSEYDEIGPGILLPNGGATDPAPVTKKTDAPAAEKAATGPSPRTLQQIMDGYYKGNYAEAYISLMPLAKNNSAEAQEVIGLMYKMGQGVEKNPKEAAFWLEKAANNSKPLSQHHLASMYFVGDGVTKDPVVGLMWIKLSIIYYKEGPGRDRARQDKRNIELHLSRRDRDRADILVKEWLERKGEGHLMSLDQQ